MTSTEPNGQKIITMHRREWIGGSTDEHPPIVSGDPYFGIHDEDDYDDSRPISVILPACLRLGRNRGNQRVLFDRWDCEVSIMVVDGRILWKGSREQGELHRPNDLIEPRYLRICLDRRDCIAISELSGEDGREEWIRQAVKAAIAKATEKVVE